MSEVKISLTSKDSSSRVNHGLGCALKHYRNLEGNWKKDILMYRREPTTLFGHTYLKAFLTRKFLFGTADEVVPYVQRFRNGVLMDVVEVGE